MSAAASIPLIGWLFALGPKAPAPARAARERKVSADFSQSPEAQRLADAMDAMSPWLGTLPRGSVAHVVDCMASGDRVVVYQGSLVQKIEDAPGGGLRHLCGEKYVCVARSRLSTTEDASLAAHEAMNVIARRGVTYSGLFERDQVKPIDIS